MSHFIDISMSPFIPFISFGGVARMRSFAWISCQIYLLWFDSPFNVHRDAHTLQVSFHSRAMDTIFEKHFVDVKSAWSLIGVMWCRVLVLSFVCLTLNWVNNVKIRWNAMRHVEDQTWRWNEMEKKTYWMHKWKQSFVASNSMESMIIRKCCWTSPRHQIIDQTFSSLVERADGRVGSLKMQLRFSKSLYKISFAKWTLRFAMRSMVSSGKKRKDGAPLFVHNCRTHTQQHGARSTNPTIAIHRSIKSNYRKTKQ